jgi:hypothetical protein
MMSGDEFLPVLDGCLHPRFTRERNDCMQMVPHKQTQPTMPEQSLMVEFHGREHGIASAGPAQLVFAPRHAIDGDKELTAIGYPLWNCVRKLFADREIHVAERN